MKDDIRRKIDAFFASYRVVKYPMNQILIFPGDKIDKVYYLKSGRICLYDISNRGDELILNTFRAPAFFLMTTAINDTPSRFFYRAESAVEVSVAPTKDVLTFIQSSPEVAFDLLSMVVTIAESLLSKIVHLMRGTAKSRLIFELLNEHRRFSAYVSETGHLYINEVGLAARTGLSRETVNRELKLLKNRGLIEVRKNKIYIMDIEKLEEILTPVNRRD